MVASILIVCFLLWSSVHFSFNKQYRCLVIFTLRVSFFARLHSLSGDSAACLFKAWFISLYFFVFLVTLFSSYLRPSFGIVNLLRSDLEVYQNVSYEPLLVPSSLGISGTPLSFLSRANCLIVWFPYIQSCFEPPCWAHQFKTAGLPPLAVHWRLIANRPEVLT